MAPNEYSSREECNAPPTMLFLAAGLPIFHRTLRQDNECCPDIHRCIYQPTIAISCGLSARSRSVANQQRLTDAPLILTPHHHRQVHHEAMALSVALALWPPNRRRAAGQRGWTAVYDGSSACSLPRLVPKVHRLEYLPGWRPHIQHNATLTFDSCSTVPVRPYIKLAAVFIERTPMFPAIRWRCYVFRRTISNTVSLELPTPPFANILAQGINTGLSQ